MAEFVEDATTKSRKTTKILLARENNDLRRRADGWKAVGALATRFCGGETFENVLNEAVREAAQVLRADVFCIMLLSPDGRSLEVRGSVGLDTDLVRPIRIDDPDSLLSMTEKDLRGLLRSGGAGEASEGKEKSGAVRAICVPLSFRGIPLGVVTLSRRAGGRFDEVERKVIQSVANQIALAAFVEGPAHLMMVRERAERELQFIHTLRAEQVRRPPVLEGWRFGLKCLPALEGGKDFHDFLPLANGRWIGAVGQTSGSGVRAAMNVFHFLLAFRGACAGGGSMESIFADLNAEVVRRGQRGQIVSLSLLELDPAANRVRLGQAGNTGAFLYEDGGVRRLQGATGTPLGVLQDVSPAVQAFDLAPETALLLYTDGLGSLADPEGEPVDREALEVCLLDQGGRRDADAPLADRVVACLLERSGGTMPEEDVTFLTLEPVPSGD